jgi:glutamyl-tRNA synthetase
LVNLGWNYDAEQEVFTREEAIARFDVAAIVPKAAAMPYSKLEWLNGIWIRQLAPAELQKRLVPFLARQLGIDPETLRASERLTKLMPLIQVRIKLLTEAAEIVDWAFKDTEEITYPNPKLLVGKNMDVAQTVQALQIGEELVSQIEEFTTPALEAAFRAFAEEMGVKVGSFFTPFRVTITGKTVSPPLFESMEILGRAETLRRIQNAIHTLQTQTSEQGFGEFSPTA